MLPARFVELRIRDTSYKFNKPTNIGFIEKRTPYIFVSKKKRQCWGAGSKFYSSFSWNNLRKKMYVRTQKELKLLLTTNAYGSSTFREKGWNFENIHLVFYNFTSSIFGKKYIVMFHSLGAFLARLFNSHWQDYSTVAGMILQQSLARLINSHGQIFLFFYAGRILQQWRSLLKNRAMSQEYGTWSVNF